MNGSDLVDVADVFYLINHLFAGGPAPVQPADANGDQVTNVADVFYLINYLFAGGPGPACRNVGASPTISSSEPAADGASA